MFSFQAVRQTDIDEKLWDEVNTVFQRGIWIQMAQQWARVSFQFQAFVTSLFPPLSLYPSLESFRRNLAFCSHPCE